MLLRALRRSQVAARPPVTLHVVPGTRPDMAGRQRQLVFLTRAARRQDSSPFPPRSALCRRQKRVMTSARVMHRHTDPRTCAVPVAAEKAVKFRGFICASVQRAAAVLVSASACAATAPDEAGPGSPLSGAALCPD